MDAAMARAVFEGFVEAVEPLILDMVVQGLRDHARIAAALNRRGIPCWGRARWTATDIRMVLSQAAAARQASLPHGNSLAS